MGNTQNHLQVGVIMGSQSDFAYLVECSQLLTELEIEHEVRIVSYTAPRLG